MNRSPALDPLLLLLAAALAGCAFDDRLPEGARVACGADAECPRAYRCRPVVGCVPRDAADVEAPAALDLVVNRRLVRPGTEVAVSFSASEPLAALPEIRLELPGAGGQLPFVVEPAGEGEAQPRYRGSVTLPPQTADGAAPLWVSLVDLVGNTSSQQPVETLRVDGTAPTVLADLTVVVLSPTAASPIASPVAMGPLVVADVAFFLDEAVPVGPGPTLTSTPAEIACTAPRADAPVDGAANAFRARCLIDPGALPAPLTGAWSLSVRAIDAAGNARDGAVLASSVAYDAEAPLVPVAGDGGLVLQRFPFGTADSPVPGVRLVAAPGVLHDGLVILERAADGVELARAEASLAMSFSLLVPGGDVELARVRQVDGAGNGSAALVVRELEWIGPAAGALAPSTLRARRIHRDRLFDERGEQIVTPAVGDQARVEGAWTYRKLGPTRLPELQYAVGAYDRLRDRGLLFGGLASVDGGAQQLNDTLWELADGDWRPAAVSDDEGDGNPLARYGAAAVWVEQESAWYLYGGATAHGSANTEYGGALADLWRFDGRSWRKLWESSPGDPGPGARALAALGYDAANREWVLFGGTAGGTSAQPTSPLWIWDGAGWAPRSPASPGPAGPLGASFFWDPGPRRLVLAFGWGAPGDGTAGEGTAWAWTGADWVADVAPPAQAASGYLVNSGAAVAADALGRPVVLGGERRSRSRTSSFCGPQPPPCTIPGGREASAEAFVRLEDAGWRALEPLPAPLSHAAAFGRRTRGEVVLVGGASGAVSAPGGDYNAGLLKSAATLTHAAGAGWRQLQGADVDPNLDLSAMTYASRAGGIIAWGQAGSFLFDGHRWRPNPLPAPPCLIEPCDLDEDPATGRLLGLKANGECVELAADAGAWTPCAPVPDGGAFPRAVAFDHGENTFRAIAQRNPGLGPPEPFLWTLRDGGWVESTSAEQPVCAEFVDPGFAWQPRVGALQLVCANPLQQGEWESRYLTAGGFGARKVVSLPPNASQAMPVTEWAALATLAPLYAGGPAVYDHAADGGLRPLPTFDLEGDAQPAGDFQTAAGAHDPTLRQTLFLGWLQSGLGSTWALTGADERPSLVLRGSLAAARLPSGATVRWVRAVLEAGANARDAVGGPQTGARLAAWNDGWQTLGSPDSSNAAPAQSPGPLWADLTGAAAALPAIAILPVGTNGAGAAELAVRRAELRVRYLAPGP